jgi:magnesium-transporting ATPase (P-type)
MKTQILKIIASFIAAAIVMILHEFPKAYAYNILSKDKNRKNKNNIYKLHHYIDPIGMLLCITNEAGFSKPYMYRIKDKKTNLILGITGFISLLVVFSISIFIVRFGLGMDANLIFYSTEPLYMILIKLISVYTARISICMFIVNLFPVSTFDMGLCIAGKSPAKYFAIIRNDYMLKMMLLMLVIFRMIPTVGALIMAQFL